MYSKYGYKFMSGDYSYDWARLLRLPTEFAHTLGQLIFLHHSALQARKRLLKDLNYLRNRLRADRYADQVWVDPNGSKEVPPLVRRH